MLINLSLDMIFPSLDKLEMGQINILFKPPVLFMVICFIYDIYSCPDLGKDLDNVPLSDINSRNIRLDGFTVSREVFSNGLGTPDVFREIEFFLKITDTSGQRDPDTPVVSDVNTSEKFDPAFQVTIKSLRGRLRESEAVPVKGVP